MAAEMCEKCNHDHVLSISGAQNGGYSALMRFQLVNCPYNCFCTLFVPVSAAPSIPGEDA
jgi:hypothetical protein